MEHMFLKRIVAVNTETPGGEQENKYRSWMKQSASCSSINDLAILKQ